MDKNDYLLDVDERRTQALLKHLKLYRLRAKVDVDDVSHEHEVWSLVGVQKQDVTIADGLLCADPRLGALGLRAVVNTDFEVPAGVCVEEGKIFSMLRMLNGVPDGRDFDGEPLPLDLAFHMLNGVSFSKGCYLGQELTARTNFTGVLRKRITPFVVTDVGEAGSVADVGELICEGPEASVEAGTQLFVEGKKKAAGKVSSSMCNVGLAVLRFNEIFSEEGQEMAQMHLGDGRRVVAYKPTWWSEGGEEDVKANA